ARSPAARRAATRHPDARWEARRVRGARWRRRGRGGPGTRRGWCSRRRLPELLPLVPGSQRVDELVDIALDHRGELVQGEADAVIRHAGLGEVVRPDALAPLPG